MTQDVRYLALNPDDKAYHMIGRDIIRRVYPLMHHAQLANPLGTLFLLTPHGKDEHGDTVHTVQGPLSDAYPVTLLEERVIGIGAQAEGAYVLRDFGPKASGGRRWVVHFRNDQLGGFSGGQYADNLPDALANFDEKADRERQRCRYLLSTAAAKAKAEA